MELVTVKNKFQIVIPQSIRERVHLDCFAFLMTSSALSSCDLPFVGGVMQVSNCPELAHIVKLYIRQIKLLRLCVPAHLDAFRAFDSFAIFLVGQYWINRLCQVVEHVSSAPVRAIGDASHKKQYTEHATRTELVESASS